MDVLNGPTPSQLQAIQEELHEDEERLETNLKLLGKWISCQPHLPKNFDNNLLSVFLRGCKHNIERTKQKLENYFITRSTTPELFLHRDPTEHSIKRISKMLKLAILPNLTPDGSRVTFFKVICTEDSDWDMVEILRYVFMTADIRVAEETAISGDIFIYDLEQVKVSHVLKYMTPILKKALVSAQDAYPQRLKQLHLVNAPSIIDKGLSLTKTLLNKKMRQRFIVHKDTKDLLQYLPSDILPDEYCGTAGKFDDFVENWAHCIIHHNKWFHQQDTIKADIFYATTIPKSLWMDLEINAIHGNFRKLEID